MASRTVAGRTYSKLFMRLLPVEFTATVLLRLEHRFGNPRIGAAPTEIAAHAFTHPLGIVAGLAFCDQTDALMICPGEQNPHCRPS